MNSLKERALSEVLRPKLRHPPTFRNHEAIVKKQCNLHFKIQRPLPKSNEFFPPQPKHFQRSTLKTVQETNFYFFCYTHSYRDIIINKIITHNTQKKKKNKKITHVGVTVLTRNRQYYDKKNKKKLCRS